MYEFYRETQNPQAELLFQSCQFAPPLPKRAGQDAVKTRGKMEAGEMILN